MAHWKARKQCNWEISHSHWLFELYEWALTDGGFLCYCNINTFGVNYSCYCRRNNEWDMNLHNVYLAIQIFESRCKSWILCCVGTCGAGPGIPQGISIWYFIFLHMNMNILQIIVQVLDLLAQEVKFSMLCLCEPHCNYTKFAQNKWQLFSMVQEPQTYAAIFLFKQIHFRHFPIIFQNK